MIKRNPEHRLAAITDVTELDITTIGFFIYKRRNRNVGFVLCKYNVVINPRLNIFTEALGQRSNLELRYCRSYFHICTVITAAAGFIGIPTAFQMGGNLRIMIDHSMTQSCFLCISGVIATRAGYISIPANFSTGRSFGFMLNLIVTQSCFLCISGVIATRAILIGIPAKLGTSGGLFFHMNNVMQRDALEVIGIKAAGRLTACQSDQLSRSNPVKVTDIIIRIGRCGTVFCDNRKVYVRSLHNTGCNAVCAGCHLDLFHNSTVVHNLGNLVFGRCIHPGQAVGCILISCCSGTGQLEAKLYIIGFKLSGHAGRIHFKIIDVGGAGSDSGSEANLCERTG